MQKNSPLEPIYAIESKAMKTFSDSLNFDYFENMHRAKNAYALQQQRRISSCVAFESFYVTFSKYDI